MHGTPKESSAVMQTADRPAKAWCTPKLQKNQPRPRVNVLALTTWPCGWPAEKTITRQVLAAVVLYCTHSTTVPMQVLAPERRHHRWPPWVRWGLVMKP